MEDVEIVRAELYPMNSVLVNTLSVTRMLIDCVKDALIEMCKNAKALGPLA